MTITIIELIYEPSAAEGKRIFDHILSILRDFDASIKAHSKFERSNDYFPSKLRKLVNTALVLAAQCTFERNVIQEITKYLVSFVKNNAVYGDVQYIEYSILRKGKLFGGMNLKSLLLAGIKNTIFHNQGYFETITNIAKKNKIELSFTPSQFDQLIQFTSNECEQCRRSHSSAYIVYLHPVIENKNQKQDIEMIVLKDLEEESINKELFGLAVIFDVIKLTEIVLNKYINQIKIRKERESNFFGSPTPNINYDLDFLLNIAYKEGLDLTDDKFNVFRGINDYYDWLLNMDSFDYSKFDPEWITIYPTKFYYKKFAEINSIKTAVEEYLKTNRNQLVEREYINIFASKTWEES